MKLHEFPILTDENIHGDVVAYLRGRGCDVLDARGGGLIGADDSVILQAAHAQNRIVVTHDADFGALAIAALEPIIGLVFLRPGHIDPIFSIGTLQALFDRDVDLTPPFIVVARRTGQEVSIRIRHL